MESSVGFIHHPNNRRSDTRADSRRIDIQRHFPERAGKTETQQTPFYYLTSGAVRVAAQLCLSKHAVV